MPIFGLSCIQSSCHNKDVAKAGLVLGDPSACTNPTGNCYDANAKWKYTFPTPPPADLMTQVLTSLVNAPSKTIASVVRVKPTDPANSFLMDKLLGTQNDKFGSSGSCQNQDTSKSTLPCGATMPLDSPSLCDQAAGDPAKVQAIAQWIQQGAQNN